MVVVNWFLVSGLGELEYREERQRRLHVRCFISQRTEDSRKSVALPCLQVDVFCSVLPVVNYREIVAVSETPDAPLLLRPDCTLAPQTERPEETTRSPFSPIFRGVHTVSNRISGCKRIERNLSADADF